MNTSLLTRLAGCLYMTVFLTSPVVAASGRMAFSGAIAEPTCDTAAVVDMGVSVVPSRTDIDAKRLSCGKPGSAKNIVPVTYRLVTVRLSGAVSDPVLKYFDEYVKADRPDMEDPLLLTRTYE
jgi:type 1 fimbria pilin